MRPSLIQIGLAAATAVLVIALVTLPYPVDDRYEMPDGAVTRLGGGEAIAARLDRAARLRTGLPEGRWRDHPEVTARDLDRYVAALYRIADHEGAFSNDAVAQPVCRAIVVAAQEAHIRRYDYAAHATFADRFNPRLPANRDRKAARAELPPDILQVLDEARKSPGATPAFGACYVRLGL